MIDGILPAYVPGLLCRLGPFERWMVTELHGPDRPARTAENVGAGCGLSGRQTREIEKQALKMMMAMQTQLAAD